MPTLVTLAFLLVPPAHDPLRCARLTRERAGVARAWMTARKDGALDTARVGLTFGRDSLFWCADSETGVRL